MVPGPTGGSSIGDRIGLALAWLLSSLGLLWAMLRAQMGGRLRSAKFNPLAGPDSN